MPLPQRAYFIRNHLLPHQILPASSDTTCAICQEDFHEVPQGVVKIQSCPHMFHRVCIVPWLQGTSTRRNTCPSCRKVLFQDIPTRDQEFEQAWGSPIPQEEQQRDRVRRARIRNELHAIRTLANTLQVNQSRSVSPSNKIVDDWAILPNPDPTPMSPGFRLFNENAPQTSQRQLRTQSHRSPLVHARPTPAQVYRDRYLSPRQREVLPPIPARMPPPSPTRSPLLRPIGIAQLELEMDDETDPHDLDEMRAWISSSFTIVREFLHVTGVQNQGDGFKVRTMGGASWFHVVAVGYLVVGGTSIFYC